MYVFRFGQVGFGYQDLSWYEDCPYHMGDLLSIAQTYYLVIGEDVAFAEIFSVGSLRVDVVELVREQLFDTRTICIMNRMVQQYHTTYKNVIALRMPLVLENLLPKLVSSPKTKKTKKHINLTIFPDVWSLISSVASISPASRPIIMTSKSTVIAKIKLWNALQQWSVKEVWTTSAEFMYPRKTLDSITVIAPDRWSYQYKSDPRFIVPEVAAYMAQVYEAHYSESPMYH